MIPSESPSSRREVPPVDLELVVTSARQDGQWGLRFELNSPSQLADFFHEPAGFQPLDSGEPFRHSLLPLWERIENLQKRRGPDKTPYVDGETLRGLQAVGLDLYRCLFPPQLQQAYRQFREKVNTLLVIYDERWPIPWELVRPFGDGLDDDFLCIRFQVSRWLPAARWPPGAVQVPRLAAVTTGGPPGAGSLKSAEAEIQMLEKLAEETPGLDLDPLPEATAPKLLRLLEEASAGAYHFAGHGDVPPDKPGEAQIKLADRAFQAWELAGSVQLGLQRTRPFVFLNACRVGRSDRWLARPDGWAERWVRSCGAGAFLGPQWPVHDKSASNFAELLYGELREGRTFGESLQAARIAQQDQEPEDLTWASYALYAHPNGRLQLGDGASPQATALPGVPAEIRQRTINFNRFIHDKTEEFVGRQWLFQRIEGFLAKSSRGYLLLQGDPGIGKSSLAAEIVRRQGCVHHFNIRSEGINRAEDFLSNVSAQLIAAYGLPHTFLPPEADQDGTFLKGLLEEVVQRHPDQKILLVVDALDEAEEGRQGVNPLFLPTILPPGIFVVATSRRGMKLRSDDLVPLPIEQDEAGNLADIQAYVEARLERPGLRSFLVNQDLSEDAFLVAMSEKSQGNFMYLRHVLPEIENGAYQDMDLDGIPAGLESYYDHNWERIRSRDEEAWFRFELPILAALTAVKEPVSIDLIAAFSEVEDLRRIHGVLSEWDSFLYQTVVEDEETGERERRYRIYHDSFHDYVAERVDLKVTHGKIADVLWNSLYGEAEAKQEG